MPKTVTDTFAACSAYSHAPSEDRAGWKPVRPAPPGPATEIATGVRVFVRGSRTSAVTVAGVNRAAPFTDCGASDANRLMSMTYSSPCANGACSSRCHTEPNVRRSAGACLDVTRSGTTRVQASPDRAIVGQNWAVAADGSVSDADHSGRNAAPCPETSGIVVHAIANCWGRSRDGGGPPA